MIQQIVREATAVRLQLLRHPILGQFVDANRADIPKPFLGDGEIRLVIIGQDPTAGPEGHYVDVNTVLKLDEPGPLRVFVEKLCRELGIAIEHNVYATNACKCFFAKKPTMIKRCEKIDVLHDSAAFWLPLLRWELDHFPHAAVLSLGEAVLSVLVSSGSSLKVRDYWGYTKQWQQGEFAKFRAIEDEYSTVARVVHPFIHQPSLRGRCAQFYKKRRLDYLRYVRTRNAIISKGS